MFKPSKFNFFYNRSNNENIVYNTFSKALISLDDEHMESLKNNALGTMFSDEEIGFLFDNGFLVEKTTDENEFLKYYNNKARFASDYFCLTIAPTLGCNFDCPYCFEDKRNGVMSEDVQNALIRFVENKIKNGVKMLEITWYGGEPLMCFDIIKTLASQITAIADSYNVKCRMGMISNGYLLNEEVVDFLEKYNVSFQITIDGMEENHNKRRYLKNGNGTYSRIIDNLKLFSNRQIDVYVRMNVDNYNYNDYSALSELVESFDNSRMILYPAITEEINERKEERKSHYMNDSVYDDFISITRKNGLFKFKSSELPISNDVSSVPDNRCYFCAAELDNSCVIDEKGNVYKCWDEVGHEDSCFNILTPEKINYDSLLRYMGDHTFNDYRCSNCVFLPLCFGGCKFHRYHLNRYACAFNDSSLISYLEDTLLN
mgnify:FL=1